MRTSSATPFGDTVVDLSYASLLPPNCNWCNKTEACQAILSGILRAVLVEGGHLFSVLWQRRKEGGKGGRWSKHGLLGGGR